MRSPRLGVAARVVLHGLLLLALVIASALVIDRMLLRPAMRERMEELTGWVAHHATEHRHEGALLASELEDVRARLHVDITVYDEARRIVASSVAPPLTASPEEVVESVTGRRLVWVEGNVAALALVDDRGRADGYAVVRMTPPPIPLDLAGVLLMAAIGAVALVSIPLTRSMLRPLRELAQVTRAYSGGDRSIRAPLRRDDEFGDLALAFNDMVDRLERLRRIERELLANVSHELRTPLARVRVLLELASDGTASEALTVLPEIAQDLAELETLIDDVLTTARLDLSTETARDVLAIPLHLHDYAPQQLVHRWVERFRLHAPGHELQVTCEALPATLRCDPVLLRRAVDNLLDNAARYSPPEKAIELHVDAHDAKLRVQVIDHGAGMSAADAARVIEPFYRVEEGRDRRTGGVGLGLALAKRVAEAHGGKLVLESTPKSGTRVTIEVPISGRMASGNEA